MLNRSPGIFFKQSLCPLGFDKALFRYRKENNITKGLLRSERPDVRLT